MRFSWLRDVGSAIRWWWTCDRIRTSPFDGQLLLLRPGDLLTIGTVDFEVTERTVREVGGEVTLTVTCVSPQVVAELVIPVDSQSSAPLWRTAHRCESLCRADIEVWPRHSKR
jgi:hypothetical protein